MSRRFTRRVRVVLLGLALALAGQAAVAVPAGAGTCAGWERVEHGPIHRYPSYPNLEQFDVWNPEAGVSVLGQHIFAAPVRCVPERP